MAVGKGLCKARNCLAKATHVAVIVVRPFKGGHFPLVFESPLTVCKDHCTQEIASALMSKENFEVIKEGLQESGYTEPLDKKQLEVNFVRKTDDRRADAPKPEGAPAQS